MSKRKLTTILATLLLMVSAVPGTAVGGDCDTDLGIGVVDIGTNTIDSTVENPTSMSQSGYFVTTVMIYGAVLNVGFELVVPAESVVDVEVVFPSTIGFLNARMEGCLPWGIVEGADPIEFTAGPPRDPDDPGDPKPK